MAGLVPRQGPYVPPKPKGGPGPGRTIHNPEPGPTIQKAQPGPGAPTGGTGTDADGGKQRGQFEGDRRNGNAGGKDRPPVYKPQDDGQRGGYVNRTIPVAAHTRTISTKAPIVPAQNPLIDPGKRTQVPGTMMRKPGAYTGGGVPGLVG